MKNKVLIVCSVLAALSVGACIMSVDDTKPAAGETIRYAAEFRGEWIRMDTGDRWYISGSSINVNGAALSLDVTLQRTSENVVTAQAGSNKYTLFAARVANASFNAKIEYIDGNGAAQNRVSRDLIGTDGQRFIVKPRNQPDLEQIVEPDPVTGEIKVEGIIPCDTVDIIPVDPDWNDVTVGLTPGFGEDQNMGVIPLTHGDNFKVSLIADYAVSDIYADGTSRTYTFELENIGTTVCGETRLEVSWDSDDFSFIGGSVREDYTNIIPGEKKQLTLTLASLPIETETKNKEFEIKIRNYDSVSMNIREWDDVVSVNFYNASVPFHFRSEKQVQGVIKAKNGRSYYFKTQGSAGNYTAIINVPWSKDEYTIAFLGATIESGSATKYSFAVDDLPPSDWSMVDMWEFLGAYKPANAYEYSAPVLNLVSGERSFMGYLAGDSIDYYKVKLGTLSEMRQRTVTFHANGADGAAPAAVTREYGTDIQLPGQGVMAKSGYLFAGWNSSSSGAGIHYDADSFYTISGDVILYAQWGISCTVMFDADGGIGIVPMPITVVSGTGIQLPDQGELTKDGYVFTGWSSGTHHNAGSIYIITGNVTLYAVWLPVYAVVYDANGGSGTMANTHFIAGESQNLRENAFTRTGYTFMGWAVSDSGLVTYTNGQSVSNLTTTAGAAITLYAVWNANIYMVVYHANGGSGSMGNSSFIYDISQNLRPNTFTNADYIFVGWADSSAGMVVYSDEESVNNLTAAAGGTVTLYAVWTVRTFLVAYDPNGGSGSMENSSFTYGTPQNLQANTFTRIGYFFAGWATSAAGPMVYTNEQSVSNLTAAAGGTVTLYAVWTGNAYMVAYNANGGTGNMENSNLTYGTPQNLRMNTLTCTNFVFAGWATDPAGTVVYVNGESVSNLTTTAGATIALYAIWTPVYTVAYNANGGTGSMSNSNFTYGVPQNLRTNTFTRTNYIFMGWAESAFGQVVYTDGESVSNLTAAAGVTVTLFAVWVQSYTVVYHANGGSGSMGNSIFPYGISRNLRANTFTYPGYSFAGWTTSESGTVVYTDAESVSDLTAMAGGIVTLYAVWTGNPYTVTYNANGGNGSMETSGFTYGVLQNLPENTFSLTNYRFIGWAVSPSGTVVYTDGQNVSNLTTEAAVTLYAVWAPVYIVAYDANGGSGSMENSSFAYGVPGNLRANTFTLTNYALVGWAASAAGPVVYTDMQSISNLTAVPGAVITIYAVWSPAYTVVYNANGGIGFMEDSSFTYGVPGNLQVNTYTRTDFAFRGWAVSDSDPVVYTDAQSIMNLTDTPGDVITLYAVWLPIVPGSTLAEKLAWLQTNAESNVDYLIEVTANESITSHTLFYSGRTNIGIILRSAAARTISLSSNGSLFTISSGATLTLEDNITFNGRSNNNDSLIRISGGGRFIMNGGNISGNTNYHNANSAVSVNAHGSGVYVNTGGTFIMNGGNISNNVASTRSIYSNSYATSYGGGVYVNTNGTFIMNSGEISGNNRATSEVTAFSYATSYGGGVYVTGGTFIMNGGRISGNRVASNATSSTQAGRSIAYGGGVYATGGTFTMNGGTISGTASSDNANTNRWDYHASYGGGVYTSGGTFRITNGTISGSSIGAGSNYGAALYGSAQYGTFNGDTWRSNGGLNTTNNTIRVVNGVLQ
ncbi:MAG: InlB B-repeat-containing protein [Treponema sp.]|nr:InlB B-repeat-containing protein [Treponema sp.]